MPLYHLLAAAEGEDYFMAEIGPGTGVQGQGKEKPCSQGHSPVGETDKLADCLK